jgi:hypothetical protein
MEESVERLGHHVERVTLTVTNALPNTVWFEAKISPYGYQQLSGFASGIRRDEGAWIWRVRLRSRAKASTSYRLQNPY